ncbi:MAG: hypothetical protein WD341_20620 [Tistlia sp.]|uniref:hypothetical protein n=1 Tax=Tistlia sp. TaxID=3057121 RepID=UPI0034A141D8
MARRSLRLLALLSLAVAALTAASADSVPAAETRRIGITGTVESVATDHFTLKDMQRDIVVEMGGHPWAGNLLALGDRVVVTGLTDDDFSRTRTIRALTLVIPKLNYPGAPDEDWLAVSGTVAAIDGDILTVDSGGRMVAADLSAVASGRFGGSGSTPLSVGDRVTVAGAVPDFLRFRHQGLRASSIALLPAETD